MVNISARISLPTAAAMMGMATIGALTLALTASVAAADSLADTPLALDANTPHADPYYGLAFDDSAPLVSARQQTLKTSSGAETRAWEWTFPHYIGNLGGTVGTWLDMGSPNMQFGVYYKHLEALDGPLYLGFEVMPFAFGAIYDHNKHPAIYSWASRLMLVFRIYSDTLAPETYLEIGIGPQYMRFRNADNFARIYEDGFLRSWIGRWRVVARVALGAEFDFFGIEFGWSGLIGNLEFDYTTFYPSQPIKQANLSGMLYVTAHFRFGS